jgi:Microtubule binding
MPRSTKEVPTPTQQRSLVESTKKRRALKRRESLTPRRLDHNFHNDSQSIPNVAAGMTTTTTLPDDSETEELWSSATKQTPSAAIAKKRRGNSVAASLDGRTLFSTHTAAMTTETTTTMPPRNENEMDGVLQLLTTTPRNDNEMTARATTTTTTTTTTTPLQKESELHQQLRHVLKSRASLDSVHAVVVSMANARNAALAIQVQQLQEDKEKLEQTLENAAKDRAELTEKLSSTLQELQNRTSELHAANEIVKKLHEWQEELHSTSQQLENLTSERDAAELQERDKDLLQELRDMDETRRVQHRRLMQLAGKIRVFVRVKPPSHGTTDVSPFTFHPNNNFALDLMPPPQRRGGLQDRREKKHFLFDLVFPPKVEQSPEDGQKEVWKACEPLVQCAVDGSHVTIFAYGPTGSGVRRSIARRITMKAPRNSPPRAVPLR